MGKIEWFDKWINDLRKKTFIEELEADDKGFIKATMVHTAHELINQYQIVAVVNNVPNLATSYGTLEQLPIEDLFKCFKWFFEGNNFEKISYKYNAEWGEEIEYMNLMCPPSSMLNRYISEFMDLKKYRYKDRVVAFKVNGSHYEVTDADGNTEVLWDDDFNRIYRIEDTNVPYETIDNGCRPYKVYFPHRVHGMIDTVHSRTTEVLVRKLDKHEEVTHTGEYSMITTVGEPGDYAVYKIDRNRILRQEYAYINSMRIISKEDFEKLLEPVTA
jgi:hypothetical protein